MAWQTHPINRFQEFQSIWQSLNEAKGNSPLLDPNFIIPLINNFSTGSEKLALFGNPQSPEIMAIITPAKKGVWESFQSSNAPLGLWLSKDMTLDNSCVTALVKQLPGLVFSIGITQQDPLFLTRPEKSNSVHSLDYIETAYINFPDNFDTYWATRSKNLRHNMKRQRNFLRKNAIETRLEIYSSCEQMRQAVADYAKIESSGWKGQINSSVTEGGTQSKFYQEMLTAFCTAGESLVLRYYYNEALVATDLCLIRDKTLYILKTTYNETIKGTSPAHIMRFEFYEKAIASGLLERVEFYGPLKDWHKKWTDNSRIIFHTNIYRNAYMAWAHRMVKAIR